MIAMCGLFSPIEFFLLSGHMCFLFISFLFSFLNFSNNALINSCFTNVISWSLYARSSSMRLSMNKILKLELMSVSLENWLSDFSLTPFSTSSFKPMALVVLNTQFCDFCVGYSSLVFGLQN